MTKDCSNVIEGKVDQDGFANFLAHVSSCKDCMRRIYSRIVIEFKQRQTEK